MSRCLRLVWASACLLFAVALVPGAMAQPVLSPSSIDRTLEVGESTSASLTLTNAGADSLRFAVRFSDGSAPRLAASGRSIRVAPQKARVERSPFVLTPDGFGADPARRGSSATDSLFYDDGDAFAANFVGAGEQNTPLLAAQRFTAPQPFILDGVRFYAATGAILDGEEGPTDLSVGVEVYAAPDPDDPFAGTLLSVSETGFQAGFEGFAEVSLPQPIDVAPGESFFVVLSLFGPAFPIVIDEEATGDAAGRSLVALADESPYWLRTEEIVGGPAPLLIRALSGASASSGFLSATPASGTLAPGASADLDLTLSARGLFAGTYQRVLEVIDLETGASASAQVTLTVTGEGAVVLSNPSVDLGHVAVGSAGGQTLTVINEGSAPLTITGATSTDPALTAFGLPVGTTLAPATEAYFAVRYAPASPGPFSGTLTVQTDVGEASVDVTANGFAAPVAVVTPDALADTLAMGMIAKLPFSIANAGDAPLTYAAFVGSGGAAGGTLQDSLLYDDGSPLPDNLVGLGNETDPLILAQRFTTGGAFSLDAVSVFASTLQFVHPGDPAETDSSSTPLTLGVEVFSAPDPSDPSAGTALASALTVVDRAASEFVTVDLGGGVDFGAGTDFFVVVRYEGAAFPVGIDALGTGDFEGRSFYSSAHEPGEWVPFPDFYHVGSPSVPLIRAVDADGSGLVVRVEPATGEVAPGDSALVDVIVDATAAEPGTFTGSVLISSNDPQQPTLYLPLTLVVEDALATRMAEGWNLVSWNVEMEDAPLQVALASVWDEVEEVQLLRDGAWTHLDAATVASETVRLRTGEAVWTRLRSDGWLVMDNAAMPATGMDLAAGSNAVAYLPAFADLASHAFASLDGAAESVQSYHSTGVAYAPGVPAAFQTLGVVRPGMGYLVRATGPVRLDYPMTAAPLDFEGVPVEALVAAEREAGVTPTHTWMSVWGEGFAGLAPGTQVTAVDPDGVVCGAFPVQADGALGLIALYADDPATEADEGARPGDTVVLRTEAGVLAEVTWTAPGAVADVSGQAVSAETGIGAPAAFALRGTYPNPAVRSATVAFDLAADADVSLDVYDTTGRLVARLAEGPMPVGTHEVRWEAGGVASGVYLVALRAGDFRATRTMVLVR